VNRNKFVAGLTAILILFCFLYSCTKIKGTDIGSDLLPVVDNISTFDTTLELVTENFLFGDSAIPRTAKTTAGQAPEMLLGYISNDPQFGKTTSTLFYEMAPVFYPYPYEVKDSLYLDSVVLCLRWTGTLMGDTNLIQKVNVFRLDSLPNGDSAYPITATIPYSQFLGTKSFAPNILNDSLYLFRQNVNNQLRIKLDNSFGNQLLGLDTTNKGPLNNDSSWNSFMKGFAVVPDVAGGPTANALMGFAISDTNTYLRLYYRYDTASKKDTTFKTFRYNVFTGFANNITRDYNGSQIAAAVGAGPDSLVYMQTAPGSYSVLHIPGMEGFRTLKGNVVINRAEISMQQIYSPGQGDDIFNTPVALYIDFQDTVNKLQLPFLRDGYSLGTYNQTNLGGARKYVPGPSGQVVSQYIFNIPSWVQGLVTQNHPIYPIYLYSPYIAEYPELRLGAKVNNIANGRVKLGGGSNQQRKMVMRIIYSKI